MRRSLGAVLALVVVLGVSACREADGFGGPATGGTRMFVTSDPSGATIVRDQRDTGARTPDTIAGLGGTHVISVRLDSAGATYDYTVQIAVPRLDSVLELHGPLTLQCLLTELTQCYSRLHRYSEVAGVRFATHAIGGLLMRNGSGQGLFWPAQSSNSYISGGMPAVAGRVNGSAVSLGIYDHHYFAARPAPVTSTSSGWLSVRQDAWITAPFGALRRFPTIRGLAVSQHVFASDQVQNVVFVRLRFTNITATRDYQLIDGFLGAAGATYTDTWIGMMLDPDIGDAGDDWFTYDPDLDMVYAYDARFSEQGFVGGAAGSPGLVGMRVLRAPEGTQVILNGWMTNNQTSADWRAGQSSEWFGLEMLSGSGGFEPRHPNRRVGHLPPAFGDARLSVSAGPLTLAPGQHAEVVIAIAVAAPSGGTFQSGNLVQPGDPFDTTREIHRIAAGLRERMQAAAAVVLPD